MARNGPQRALNQLNKCFFAYFISGTALTCRPSGLRQYMICENPATVHGLLILTLHLQSISPAPNSKYWFSSWTSLMCLAIPSPAHKWRSKLLFTLCFPHKICGNGCVKSPPRPEAAAAAARTQEHATLPPDIMGKTSENLQWWHLVARYLWETGRYMTEIGEIQFFHPRF